jgi:hypothetical protein
MGDVWAGQASERSGGSGFRRKDHKIFAVSDSSGWTVQGRFFCPARIYARILGALCPGSNQDRENGTLEEVRGESARPQSIKSSVYLRGLLDVRSVVTVWIIPVGKEAPVLVTVYPER